MVVERTTVERDGSPVWIIVGVLVAVLLIAMFIWPGWVYAPFAADNEGDTINIEQPEQDVDIEQPDGNIEQPDGNIEQPDGGVEQPDSGTDAAPEDETTP